jgi:hypothetical protein
MTSALKAISSAAEYIPDFLRNPDDEDGNKNVKLYTVTYCFKKFVLVTGKFSELPTGWATTLRKANDFVLPYLAQIGNFASEFAKVGAPFSIAFMVADLGESWNDFNYLLNGDLYEDLLNSRIFSAIGHLLLLPVNLIGTAQFLQAVDLANTLGGTRVFYYVEKVTNLRWINAIPGLNSAAMWLSQEGWINVVATFGTLADGCLLGAFIGLGLDGRHRWKTCGDEAQRYKQLYENALKIERGNLADIVDVRTHKIKDLYKDHAKTHIAVKLLDLKAKWFQNENDAAQGKRDVAASVSEVMLKGALMAGVTSPLALAVFGTLAFVAVGTSLYHRVTSSKPDTASLLR